MSDKVLQKISNLKNSYDQFTPKDNVEFNNTDNDRMTFTFFRYLLLRNMNSQCITIEFLNDTLEKYKELAKQKTLAANFVKMNFVDYFWIKTQHTIYNTICDGGYDRNNWVFIPTCIQDVFDIAQREFEND